ncbi:MAG: reprolysin-like metallopeptidase [Myxococcaceae bacterium]
MSSLGLIAAILAAAPATVPVSFQVVCPADGGTPVEDAAALEQRLARATELYAEAGLNFTVSGVAPISTDRLLDLAGRADRDALADFAVRPQAAVQVFVVRSAKDLDPGAGNIAGVHWRYGGKSRAHAGRRYEILSSSDSTPETLAHELGHWFGLAHSSSAQNLMAPSSARADNRLTPGQVERIRGTWRDAVKRGELATQK